VYTENVDEQKQITDRLDVIIELLREAGKPEPLVFRIANWFGLAVTIFGIVAVIDILRQWLGG